MDIGRYLGKKVCLTLTNNYFYRGVVVDCDEDSLTIKDVTGKELTLKPSAILTIREDKG